MENFYIFGSCNYLTTFAAEPELYSGLISGEEEQVKAIAYYRELSFGSFSNEDIEFPIIFREQLESGKRFRDILDNRTISLYLISDRFKNILQSSGLTGWKCYPIELYDKFGHSIRGYHGLSIIGKAGKMKKHKTPPMDLGYSPNSYGYYFDVTAWDGSDIFNPKDSNFMLVTKSFIDTLVKHKITSCEYIQLTNYGDSSKYKYIR